MEPQVCEPTVALQKVINEATGWKYVEMKTVKDIPSDTSLTPRSSLETGLKQSAFSSWSYSKGRFKEADRVFCESIPWPGEVSGVWFR